EQMDDYYNDTYTITNDTIELIHKEQFIEDLKLLNKKKYDRNNVFYSYGTEGTLLFITNNISVHDIIKKMQLLPIVIENIVCEYANDKYEINYTIRKSSDSTRITLISKNDLEFSFIINNTPFHTT